MFVLQVLAFATLVSITILSVVASPLYMSVPGNRILTADDFKRINTIPRAEAFQLRQYTQGSSVNIMLMSRVSQDEHINEFENDLPENHELYTSPGPVVVERRRGGSARSGRAGSSSGGTVSSNGKSAGQAGRNGRSTRGSGEDGA